MKFALILTALISSSAFATDFFAKIENNNCKIENGLVTRTSFLGKEATASFTETKNVKIEGIAHLVAKAIEVSSPFPGNDVNYRFTMKHEGTAYLLDTRDSSESMALINMIARLCR